MVALKRLRTRNRQLSCFRWHSERGGFVKNACRKYAHQRDDGYHIQRFGNQPVLEANPHSNFLLIGRIGKNARRIQAIPARAPQQTMVLCNKIKHAGVLSKGNT
jgi:hypothetical protein